MKILERTDSREEFVKRSYENETYKRMKVICAAGGYYLGLSYIDEYGYPNITLTATHYSRFQPEVYPPDEIGGKWKVSTTSYGSLDKTDLETFVNDYTIAYNMIEELSKIDLSGLEHKE